MSNRIAVDSKKSFKFGLIFQPHVYRKVGILEDQTYSWLDDLSWYHKEIERNKKQAAWITSKTTSERVPNRSKKIWIFSGKEEKI